MSSKPFSNIAIQRIMLLMIVLLSLAAGYFYTAYGFQKKKNTQLLNQIERLETSESNL